MGAICAYCKMLALFVRKYFFIVCIINRVLMLARALMVLSSEPLAYRALIMYTNLGNAIQIKLLAQVV